MFNFGKGVAENIKMDIYLTNMDGDEKITTGSLSLSNKIYPDSSTPFSILLNAEGNINSIEEIISGRELALIIKLTFIDYVSEKEIIIHEWGKIRLDHNSLIIMSIEEKNKIEPYYLDLFHE